VQTGRWDVPGSILHPPFFYYLSSFPLMFVETDPTVWRSEPSKSTDLNYLASGDIPRGQALLSSPANRDDWLLTWSRLTMVAMAVLLGCIVFVWSARLYGPSSAVLAAVLFTFCPNIMAHARLVTPDISVTTFSFITIYCLWRVLNTGAVWPALCGGVCLGLALLCKFTALLLLPTILALVLLWHLAKGKTNWTRCAVLVGLGLAILVVGYGGDLTPFWGGLEIQRRLAGEGHASFLFGEISSTGWWYYLIVAFLVKTPLAAIALIVMALVMAIGRTQSKADWVDHAFLVAPVIVTVAFFSVGQQSIGLRYILPIFPFLFVFCSQVLRSGAMGGYGRQGAVAALACWYVGAALWIHPNYLAYFNESVGGPKNGYTVLVDSNLDWGQGLKQLKAFMTTHRINKVALSYFGTDAPERFGIDYVSMPSLMLLNPAAAREMPDPNGWFAISATNLQGVYFGGHDPFAPFRKRTPEATIGYNMFLYHGLR
jgi:4-amino-4-deoxy-L-arabinose transferase-like glycosyltransferase